MAEEGPGKTRDCSFLPCKLGELSSPRRSIGKSNFADIREAHGCHSGPVIELVSALDQDVGAVRADDGHEDCADHSGREARVLEGIGHCENSST